MTATPETRSCPELSGNPGELEVVKDYLTTAAPAAPAQEPYCYLYKFSDPMSGSPVWRRTPDLWNGQRPSGTKPLYATPVAPAPVAVKNLLDRLHEFRAEITDFANTVEWDNNIALSLIHI